MVNSERLGARKATSSTMIKYEIIKSNRIASLEEQVESKMKKGWRPQGGIEIDRGIYYQAMIK